MIRAALAPKQDSQHHCVLWLEQYFDVYGDKMPNKDETRLALMEVKDLYEQYKADFASHTNSTITAVSYEVFCSIWSVIFPDCAMRSYTDIPGKCETCFRIDELRRKSSDETVQKKLSEAHHLHRGGMFMLERRE